MRALLAVSDAHVARVMFTRWRRGLEVLVEEEYASVEIQRFVRGYLHGKLLRYRARRLHALQEYESNEEAQEERERQRIAACTLQRRARIFLASRKVTSLRAAALLMRRSKVLEDALGESNDKKDVVNAYFGSQCKSPSSKQSHSRQLAHSSEQAKAKLTRNSSPLRNSTDRRMQEREATRIQAWFRAERERNGIIREKRAVKHMAHAVKRNAVTKIQARWRGKFLRRIESTIRAQALVRGWHARFQVRKERRKQRLDAELQAKQAVIFNALRGVGFTRYRTMKNVCESMAMLGLVSFPDSRDILRETIWEERELYQLRDRRKRMARSQDKFEKFLFGVEEATSLGARELYRRIRDGWVLEGGL